MSAAYCFLHPEAEVFNRRVRCWVPPELAFLLLPPERLFLLTIVKPFQVCVRIMKHVQVKLLLIGLNHSLTKDEVDVPQVRIILLGFVQSFRLKDKAVKWGSHCKFVKCASGKVLALIFLLYYWGEVLPSCALGERDVLTGLSSGLYGLIFGEPLLREGIYNREIRWGLEARGVCSREWVASRAKRVHYERQGF